MVNPPLLLVFFSFLLLATADAAPSGRKSIFGHLPSTPEAEKTAHNRRCSSLWPPKRAQRDQPFPAKKKSPLEDTHEESSLNESSHPEDPFEAQMQSYDEAIVAALEKFNALAQQISSSLFVAHNVFDANRSAIEIDPNSSFSQPQAAFIANVFNSSSEDSELRHELSAIEENKSSSLGKIKAAVTAHLFLSQDEESNLDFENSDQENEATLFNSLSDAKADVASSTYFYTTSLLGKIISSEVTNPSDAANHWADLVEKTKNLIAILEQYQSICTNHFSSKRDPLEELAYEIDFYKARLAEYEAEESSADTLVARNNYLSPPDLESSKSSALPQDRAHQGSALAALSTQVPVNFHEAAEAYRSISKDIAPETGPEFREVMALWCEARAAEIAITAVSDAALVHEIKWPHEELSKKAQEAYDTVITACKNLAPKFSDNEDLQPDKDEIERYLQEAVNRKQFITTQLQQTRVYFLLPLRLNETASEHEKFLHHENLFRQLQSFQTVSQTGLKEAPERLKSLWQRFDQDEISFSIETITSHLRENIFNLLNLLEKQAERPFSLLKQKLKERQTPLTLETASSTNSLLSLADSSSPNTPLLVNAAMPARLSWAQVIREAETTSKECKVVLAAAKNFSNMVLESTSADNLQNYQNYWDASVILARAYQNDSRANREYLLSQEALGRTRTFHLEKASQHIEQTLAHWRTLHGMTEATQSSGNVVNETRSPLGRDQYNNLKQTFESKQRKIKKALEESKKTSWTAWFCSFFNMPQWFYFWRTAPVS
ncbi:MAG: hypothetical protein K2W97_01890 [Chthoniobacterales bacterium]|nr:hypothetical protein [Chthoniobacterales bacterium]